MPNSASLESGDMSSEGLSPLLLIIKIHATNLTQNKSCKNYCTSRTNLSLTFARVIDTKSYQTMLVKALHKDKASVPRH